MNNPANRKSFVIDSWAWIEYFDGSSKGKEVSNYVENKNMIIITTPVTVAEIVSRFLRKHMDPHQAVSAIETLSNISSIGTELATFAGELHAEIRTNIKDFGLADAFVLATARRLKARILSGDPHFKGFKEAVLI